MRSKIQTLRKRGAVLGLSGRGVTAVVATLCARAPAAIRCAAS